MIGIHSPSDHADFCSWVEPDSLRLGFVPGTIARKHQPRRYRVRANDMLLSILEGKQLAACRNISLSVPLERPKLSVKTIRI